MNTKVNTKLMIDTKYIFFAHLQGLKNPLPKLSSSPTQNFALKQAHASSTDQTYVIIISCSKEWRHSKCWLPLRGWENFSSLCVYVSHWKKGKVVHLSGWVWLPLVLCLVLLETKWMLCCKIIISQNRRFAEIDFSKMIQLWYNSICQHKHSTTLSLAQLLINIILP